MSFYLEIEPVIGGLKWKSAIFSSYVILFGVGNALKFPYTPNSSLYYHTFTLLQPDEQAIAADTWIPVTSANFNTTRTFIGAGPGSGTDPITLSRPIMHQNSNGLNILYGDGHVTWKTQNQVIFRLHMGSGGSAVYW